MKKIIFAILLWGTLLVGVTGCFSEREVQKTFFESEQEVEKSFLGKVIEVGEKHIIVKPNEDEEEKEYLQLLIKFDNIDNTYKVNNLVKITYNGVLEESYPAQIKTDEVKLIPRDFKLVFNKLPGNVKYQIIDKKTNKNYNYNVYILGGNIEIVINNKTYPLETALKNNVITMEEIIEKANQDIEEPWIYLDGGSKEYHYEDYTIIKLHTLDGNRDVYFGNKDLNINDFAH